MDNDNELKRIEAIISGAIHGIETIMLEKKEFGSVVKFRPHQGAWDYKSSKIAKSHDNVVFKVLDSAINYHTDVGNVRTDNTEVGGFGRRGLGNAKFVPVLGKKLLLYAIDERLTNRNETIETDILGLAMLVPKEVSIKRRPIEGDAITSLFDSKSEYTITGKYDFRELREDAPKLTKEDIMSAFDGTDYEGTTDYFQSFKTHYKGKEWVCDWILEHSDVTQEFVFCVNIDNDMFRTMSRFTSLNISDLDLRSSGMLEFRDRTKPMYPYITRQRIHRARRGVEMPRYQNLRTQWSDVFMPSLQSISLWNLSTDVLKSNTDEVSNWDEWNEKYSTMTLSGYGAGSIEHGDMYYIKTKYGEFGLTQVLMKADSPNVELLEQMTYAIADGDSQYIRNLKTKIRQKKNFGGLRIIPEERMLAVNSTYRTLPITNDRLYFHNIGKGLQLGYQRLGNSESTRNYDAENLSECLERMYDAKRGDESDGYVFPHRLGRIYFDLPVDMTTKLESAYVAGAIEPMEQPDSVIKSGRYELVLVVEEPNKSRRYYHKSERLEPGFTVEELVEVENMIDHLRFVKVVRPMSRLSSDVPSVLGEVEEVLHQARINLFDEGQIDHTESNEEATESRTTRRFDFDNEGD